MDRPALLDLVEIKNYPVSEVGDFPLLLSKLAHQGIPIAPTAIIPRYTLERLAISTGLEEQLKRELASFNFEPTQTANLMRRIQKIVGQMSLPHDVAEEILNWYHRHPGYLKITTASKKSKHPAHHNVEGDANVIDSFLSIWAENLEIDPEKKELRLFAEPIILQHFGQPLASGYALTISPDNKSRLNIYSVWGNYSAHHSEIEPDEIEVDIRTKLVTKTQVNPQYVELFPQRDGYREKAVRHYQQHTVSLDRDLAGRLAEILIQIKRYSYEDQQVNWYLENGQLWITKVKPLDQLQVQQLSTEGQILVRGETLQSGIATGLVQTVNRHQAQLPPGAILVTKNLANSQVDLISQASAIICEQGVDSPSLFQHIKQLNIPTIVNAHQAAKILQPGQEVIVDANSGRVMMVGKRPEAMGAITAPQTMTRVYLTAGNPAKAKQYLATGADGVGVLKSEFTFASFGQHPEYVIQTHQRHQLHTNLVNAILAFQESKVGSPVIYRSQDLTSQEFKMLDRATSFEPEENNPYLGFRGGLRMIRRYDLLDFELEAVAEAVNKSSSHIGFLLPFVRTPAEMKLIGQRIQQKRSLRGHDNFGLYLQLNTPENILNLKHYFQAPLDGVIVNTRSLHGLLHGFDPEDPEMAAMYPFDISLMRHLLSQVITNIQHTQTKAMVLIEDYSLELVEMATQLGFNAVIVRPQFVSRVKDRVHEIETEKMSNL